MIENRDYDVIIVGGRVAGSTLAARLGYFGFRVLLLERATFPSPPAVSSPIIYAAALELLDEIGANEAEYARNTPRIRHMIVVNDHFTGKIKIPMRNGRDYAYAIDRSRFDFALWQHAVSMPGVEGRQNFSATDLLWDNNRVIGIVGKSAEGRQEEITAQLVVGADGRFSTVARKAGATIADRYDRFPTSIYYAYWENVRHFDEDGHSVSFYEGKNGTGYLVADSADEQTLVAIEGRTSSFEQRTGSPLDHYLSLIRQNPRLCSRTQNAEPVTTLRGMKNIGNLYHQAGGPGWALVGDAYHHKDPLDAQGIYNATVTAKALSQAIRKWLRGEISWQKALARYDEIARIKTYSMFRDLQARIQLTIYNDFTPPAWFYHTVLRWITQDPLMRELVGKTLTRQIPPDLGTLMTPPAALGAMLLGPLRDLRQFVKKQSYKPK